MKVKVTYVGTKILDVPDENFECADFYGDGESSLAMSRHFIKEEDENNLALAQDWTETDAPITEEYISCIEEADTDKIIYEY